MCKGGPTREEITQSVEIYQVSVSDNSPFQLLTLHFHSFSLIFQQTTYNKAERMKLNNKNSNNNGNIWKSRIMKVGIMILSTALAVRLFLAHSSSFNLDTVAFSANNNVHTHISHKPIVNDVHPVVSELNITQKAEPSFDAEKQPQRPEKCDLFTGEWIPNPAGPTYTNDTCKLIEGQQNCMRNGRPDSGYLYWKWSPRHCSLPSFDAQLFLETMRNKVWALIGDSISRNHMQSLMCMLSKVEEPVFVYHDEGYKSKGWRFPSYNVTIYVMWSPFLTEAAIYEDYNGVSSREVDLHLDRLDRKWTDMYKNSDYMIFSTGKWFLKTAIYYENNTVLGCHGCHRPNMTELGFDFAYRKSLRFVLNSIATSGHKGLIFFRTSTPDHFEGGEWSTGGRCNRTVPFKEGEIEVKDLHQILRRIELEEFDSAAEVASQNGVRLVLLDFMQLSLLRPDGHPGPYRQSHPFAKDKNAQVQNDCLHWCLPGPIDAWNDIVMEMAVNG